MANLTTSPRDRLVNSLSEATVRRDRNYMEVQENAARVVQALDVYLTERETRRPYAREDVVWPDMQALQRLCREAGTGWCILNYATHFPGTLSFDVELQHRSGARVKVTHVPNVTAVVEAIIRTVPA